METSKQTESILRAVEFLQRGELVAFPTETVYGLGCDATSAQALARLYAAKGRPEDHPVIVHIYDPEQMRQWGKDVPQSAFKLAQAFWPGPLTLILKRADHVLNQVTGGQPTIGLRLPSHPLAQELLRSFGKGVAAPSANKFGRLSPTCAGDVIKEFGPEIALVLDGGVCQVGIESTIVDLSGEYPRILRPGMIDCQRLSDVLSLPVAREQIDQTSVRVPGALLSHYAPATPLHLVPAGRLAEFLQERLKARKRFSVLSFQAPPIDFIIDQNNCGGSEERADGATNNCGGSEERADGATNNCGGSEERADGATNNWITASTDPADYARQLYRNLRQLDKLSLDEIIVEEPPAQPLWAGIRDRLLRAAAKPRSV